MAGPIVFLGRVDSPVLAHLRAVEDDVVAIGPSERFDPSGARFAVSHGYRLIIKPDVIERVEIVNLHISYLPFNRGADPTLWSVLEATPAGVSIHYIDAGVDTGDLIAQRPVTLTDDDTLATAYATLQHEIADVFREQWPGILAGTCDRRPQPPGGTTHRVADRVAVEHLLTDGWDTPIAALRGRCAPSS